MPLGHKRATLALLAATAAAALASGVGAVAPAAAGQSAPAAAAATVTVDTSRIVQKDYLGVGVDVIPWSLMSGTTTLGYDEADWQVDVERILTLRPKVARLWFQIDWMEPQKGVYTFDSDKMKAVYRYLDAFKRAGTDVELNFGWKVGAAVQSWFSIPGVSDPTISAPADLPAYGRSASALLTELQKRRHYDNVKYLTFYNEPNGSWDFAAPGDEKAYYAAMATAVDAQLRADRLRDGIQIWGPEEVSAPDWTAYMQQHAPGVFDQYSFHLYGEAYDSLDAIFQQRKDVIAGKPLNLTEMGWVNPGTSVWETGYANYLIKSANDGIHSNLIWALNGVMTDDPAGDTNGSYNLWDSVILGLKPSAAFYEAGLLMRYIPAHSTVYSTTTDSPDVRATAYRAPDGELTVLAETKQGPAKNVTVRFTGGKPVNAAFTRFAYTDDIAKPEENALLPASSGVLKAKRSQFTDTGIGTANTFVLYTTAPPETQVALDPVQTTVVGGAKVGLKASVIDGKQGIRWEVVGTGNGSVDRNGVFTAPAVTTERTVAVKAVSTHDDSSYKVAQVLVVPAHRAGVTDAPVASLKPGVYASTEAVFLSSATPGAVIHYTTDGTVPTAASPVATGPVFLQPLKTTYLRAIAVAPGSAPSGVTSRLYKVQDVQNAPDGYTFCAYADRNRCDFTGTASVAFGSDGLFSYATLTDGTECTASVFGGDPNPGGDNRCFYSTTIPDEPPLVTIYNAGFEKPATMSTANGPMVNGWTFSARAGTQYNVSPFVPDEPAPEGTHTAYLKTDSGLGSSITQEVTFPAGTYKVTFQAAIRTGFGGKQTFDVTIDGTVVGSYAPADGHYTPYSTDAFTLGAGKHTIGFVATTTDGDNTAFIDDVKVVAG